MQAYQVQATRLGGFVDIPTYYTADQKNLIHI